MSEYFSAKLVTAFVCVILLILARLTIWLAGYEITKDNRIQKRQE
jgi:hypothetical protein